MHRRYIITSYNQYKLNYWAIPKCANTSIKSALLNKIRKNTYHQNKWVHKNRNNPWLEFEEAINNNFINFTVTRNPYDRFLSLYKHFGVLEPFAELKNKKINLDYFVNFICNEYGDDKTCNYHVRQQIFYISDQNLKICVDDVYKLENIDNFWKKYSLPKVVVNKSKTNDFSLTNSQKELIYQRYKKDFILLGYKK